MTSSVLPNIMPLFWLHGEPFPVLEEEVRAMHRAGFRGFILESRPFPDYLGPFWWETLHFLLDLAEKLGMKVLLFDDSHFPSGYADGIIAREHPEYLRLLLAGKKQRIHMDSSGDYTFDSDHFLEDGDRQVMQVFFLPMSDEKTFKSDEVIVCPPEQKRVHLCSGDWMILVSVITRNGGENHTRNYINMISFRAVREYIRVICERHTHELAQHIGKSFFGFFSDEPRLANQASYASTIGTDMPLPYSGDLRFDWRKLPHLLLHSTDLQKDREIRVEFMNRVSRLYSECFPQQIGAFCRSHDLVYIGHIVEDDGAHARLGYGDGHYFRSQEGQSWAGVDTVLGQNRPGHTEGILDSVFGHYHCEFFHWGLMNLASSMGTLRKMPSFCEIFGAYGWGEGLSRMKWHTDLALVRGISRLVPHAFSPKECPDPDCPPHFYARGQNPQWPFFPLWVQYAEKVCDFISGGTNAASVGILYHAEAEWGNGTALPSERLLSVLAKKQIASLIVPFDDLEKAHPEKGILQLGDAGIDTLLVGDFDDLPAYLQQGLLRLEREGIWLVRVTENNLPELTEKLDRKRSLRTADDVPHLRVLPLRSETGLRYFLVNESLTESVHTKVSQWNNMKFFDPLRNRNFQFQGELFLLPGESIFLEPGTADEPLPIPRKQIMVLKKDRLCCRNGNLPEDFCGTAVYEVNYFSGAMGKVILHLPDQQEDVVQCSVNGKEPMTCFAPPYRFELDLNQGENQIQLSLTNTLFPRYGKNRFDEDCPPLSPGLHSDIVILEIGK